MSIRYRKSRAIVHCDICPGQPILDTPTEDIDTRKCVRCQGERRWLNIPHPSDHLCGVCRRECPSCQAVTSDGELCLRCQGKCRACRGWLPERSAAEVVRVEPSRRKDGRGRRFAKIYVPQTWDQDLCDACQNQGTSHDPVRAVLAALPGKVMKACGSSIPAAVLETLRAELVYRTPRQLADRIDRRWWNSWASRPLHRESDDDQDGYRPADVALWLIAPNPCRARCEDGWVPGDEDQPCPTCRGTGSHIRIETESETDYSASELGQDILAPTAADRSVAAALAHRPPLLECEGQDGACGRPTAPGYSRCPTCLEWPWCACNRQRYDPQRATACRLCRTSA